MYRKRDAETKRRLVERWLSMPVDECVTLTQFARSLGIHHNVFRRWVKAHAEENGGDSADH